MTEYVQDWFNNDKISKSNTEEDSTLFDDNPLTTFLYALKSSESKRQYPSRLMRFFDHV